MNVGLLSPSTGPSSFVGHLLLSLSSCWTSDRTPEEDDRAPLLRTSCLQIYEENVRAPLFQRTSDRTPEEDDRAPLLRTSCLQICEGNVRAPLFQSFMAVGRGMFDFSPNGVE
ncbi:hypothetical protein RJT34_17904 [Clitoria ternatea]|uniref:Uncharacterized protein n=1 Tax=Clitoria ternatea TaxID=43366 RepID=A0AAN9JB41_CLITE